MTQAREKATAVKQQVAEKTTQVRAQVRDKAAHVGELAREKAPEPVREKADEGMRMARANRTPLYAAAGALIALLFVRRARSR
ncbi:MULTISPECIES: hypothetical protein [unclassified Streptomyces]|uniref:hypothetical protein n=1 Tax=unclassified Streptomyces TaxID=2593676 RepID=UPI0033A7A645